MPLRAHSSGPLVLSSSRASCESSGDAILAVRTEYGLRAGGRERDARGNSSELGTGRYELRSLNMVVRTTA